MAISTPERNKTFPLLFYTGIYSCQKHEIRLYVASLKPPAYSVHLLQLSEIKKQRLVRVISKDVCIDIEEDRKNIEILSDFPLVPLLLLGPG